jgi:hypothetical protein
VAPDNRAVYLSGPRKASRRGLSPSTCRLARSDRSPRFRSRPVDGRVAMFISENASELWAIDVSEDALLKIGR